MTPRGLSLTLLLAVFCHSSSLPAQALDGGAPPTALTSTPDGGTEIPPDGGATPRTADECHEEGVRLLRARKNEAAIVLFRQAVALDDQSALFVTDLGYAYLKQHRYVEAETAFRKGILLDPNRPHAYGHLVESIVKQPNRWNKRQDLLSILDQGLSIPQAQEARHRLELARIRAERSFGLVERARVHIEALQKGPKLPRGIDSELLELKASLEQDKKALALRDWPEPNVDQESQRHLTELQGLGEPHARKAALPELSRLLARYPAWHAPRRLRALILTEQGHYDEAVKELTILTRLVPSDPVLHRQLGLLLAEHGGLLELERADEALRIALSLEPEWTELETVRQQLAARRYDAGTVAPKVTTSAPNPSENARRLFEEASGLLEEDSGNQDAARELLEQALRESPSHVKAAALSYSLTRKLPDSTVKALWNDGAALFSLHQEFARVEPPAPRGILDGWLNRAIDLGQIEARLTRALNDKRHGDKQAAELELASYIALVSGPEEVDAAQLLRAELGDKPKPEEGAHSDTILNARLRLARDDPDGALSILEAPCRSPMEPERLLTLGIVYERQGRPADALDCYELELQKVGDNAWRGKISRRMARLLARSEVTLLSHPAAARLPQLAALEPAALWALSRLALVQRKTQEATDYAGRYLAQATANDRFRGEAKALQERLQKSDALEREMQRRRRTLWSWLAAGILGVLAFVGYLLQFGGITVARAIRRRPRLFPGVVRIVGELRHDVLKHRTSALPLLRNDQTTVEKLRSTVLLPVPTSTVVAQAYRSLSSLARAEGLTLRRLHREPVFGSLVKDLALLEHALEGTGDRRTIERVDTRLRTEHRERLRQLLSQGPRCPLDAAELQRWITALEAEVTAQGALFTVPALRMSDPCLTFPIPKAALHKLFVNLLRNAEAAVSQEASPRIQVSLVRETDFTGQPAVLLLIADNSSKELTLETIESQDPGRGLGIVRDTARDWHAHLVITEEPAPYRKSVGVKFAP